MGDLEVATDEMRALGGRLDQLSGELKSQDGNADYSTSTLGHRYVVDAMEEFRDNWNDNRDHLAEKLGKLGEHATETAKGFDEADAELASQITDMMEESA